MEAIVWPDRVDILGAGGLPRDSWEPLLDELRAKHVPSFTPEGRRMAAVGNPRHGWDAFVYRTAPMRDEEVIGILAKYGIAAKTGEAQ